MWCRVRPSLNRGALSSNPETNCDEALASIFSTPPETVPVPKTLNGRELESLTLAPSARKDSMVVCIGLSLAPSSPSKTTSPIASIASGGTKRITVPANPQSILTSPASCFGVTTRSSPCHSKWVPKASRALIIRSESLDRSGEISLLGPLARAESTSSRLVSDLLPGSDTVASKRLPLGAGQSSCSEII